MMRYYFQSAGNHRPKRGSCGNHAAIGYRKLRLFRKDIKRAGQREGVDLVEHQGMLYPVAGATRLSCLMSLMSETFKGRVLTKDKATKWKDTRDWGTHHWDAFPSKLMGKLLLFHDSIVFDNNKGWACDGDRELPGFQLRNCYWESWTMENSS